MNADPTSGTDPEGLFDPRGFDRSPTRSPIVQPTIPGMMGNKWQRSGPGGGGALIVAPFLAGVIGGQYGAPAPSAASMPALPAPAPATSAAPGAAQPTGSPSGAPNKSEEDCCDKEKLKDVYRAMAEVETRLVGLHEDKYNQKVFAPCRPLSYAPMAGSWNGHIQALEQAQKFLRRAIADAMAAKCKVPPFAWKLAYVKPPPRKKCP